MEDKRIRKTKNGLKQTMLRLLESKPFEQVTVKELCAESDTSRITFYTHYTDKYDLMDEICQDLVEIARRDYHQMQMINNLSGDAVLSFCNLLDSILNLFTSRFALFRHTIVGDSPYLNAAFYRYILKFVRYRIQKDQAKLQIKYSPEAASGFLVHGLWGFFREGRLHNEPMETVRAQARQLLQSLLRSPVLTQRDAFSIKS